MTISNMKVLKTDFNLLEAEVGFYNRNQLEQFIKLMYTHHEP